MVSARTLQLFAAACLVSGASAGPSWWKELKHHTTAPMITKAVVVLKGPGDASGVIVFDQPSGEGPVSVTGDLWYLDANSQRGLHVHEFGDLSDGCASAGLHWNPTESNHGDRLDHTRHVGDLGNINTDHEGKARFEFKDSVISLNGPHSIVGRAVVLHAGTDDLGKVDNDGSRSVGNSGGRTACGVIGAASS